MFLKNTIIFIINYPFISSRHLLLNCLKTLKKKNLYFKNGLLKDPKIFILISYFILKAINEKAA